MKCLFIALSCAWFFTSQVLAVSNQTTAKNSISGLAAGGADFYLPTPVLLQDGHKIYDDNCSGCHGADGRGDGFAAAALPLKPRNYRAEKFKYGNTPSAIVATIALGRSNVMPPFAGALQVRQIWALAHYVWSLMPPSNRATDDAETLQHWQMPHAEPSKPVDGSR